MGAVYHGIDVEYDKVLNDSLAYAINATRMENLESNNKSLIEIIANYSNLVVKEQVQFADASEFYFKANTDTIGDSKNNDDEIEFTSKQVHSTYSRKNFVRDLRF